MERNVVRTFLYPTFLDPPPSLAFSDQFAFHPSGSTSVAIISLLHTVINLLQFNPFVVVISLDFSQAFDTIRHSTLLSKLAELDLPTPVYNWLVDFFSGHSHHTCSVEMSRAPEASQPVSYGWSIGSAAYTVTAADFRPLNPDNIFIKFVDNTYLVISIANISTRAAEIDNTAACAAENNLKLN